LIDPTKNEKRLIALGSVTTPLDIVRLAYINGGELNFDHYIDLVYYAFGLPSEKELSQYILNKVMESWGTCQRIAESCPDTYNYNHKHNIFLIKKN